MAQPIANSVILRSKCLPMYTNYSTILTQLIVLWFTKMNWLIWLFFSRRYSLRFGMYTGNCIMVLFFISFRDIATLCSNGMWYNIERKHICCIYVCKCARGATNTNLYTVQPRLFELPLSLPPIMQTATFCIRTICDPKHPRENCYLL